MNKIRYDKIVVNHSMDVHFMWLLRSLSDN